MDKKLPSSMNILSMYKQPVILCSQCDSLLCYNSFILKEHEHFTKFKVLFNYSIEELDGGTEIIGLFCILCEQYLGIKMVFFRLQKFF